MIDFGLSIKRNHGWGDSLGSGYANGQGRGGFHHIEVLGDGDGCGSAAGFGQSAGSGKGKGTANGLGYSPGYGKVI